MQPKNKNEVALGELQKGKAAMMFKFLNLKQSVFFTSSAEKFMTLHDQYFNDKMENAQELT